MIKQISYETHRGNERSIEIVECIYCDAYRASNGKSYLVEGPRLLVQSASGRLRSVGHIIAKIHGE